MSNRSRKFIATVLLAGVCVCATSHAAAADQTTAGEPPASEYVATLLNKARQADHSSQAIVVTAEAADEPRASLVAYAFAAGHWEKVMGPVPAVLGKKGISLHSREGDMKSPAGMFYMGRGFGSGAEPDGVKLPFTRTTKYDYWVDDMASDDYNRWETYYGDPDKRWKSYERLKIPAYEYAMVIRYNMSPIKKGRGSAIFFHIWPGQDGFTAGCTAVSRENVVKVMQWLDPAKRPVIIQGTAAQLKSLAREGEAR